MDKEKTQEEIIQALGLDTVPEEERNELLADMGEVVYVGAIRKALQSLGLKKREQLTALLVSVGEEPEDDAKREDVDAFLKKNVPAFDEFMNKEIGALQSTYESVHGELTS